MRKSVGLLCSLALVLPGVGSASLAQEAPPEPAEREGFCRLPVALPDLGPETENQQTREDDLVRRSRGAEGVETVTVTGSR
ncbi:MAG: hypothetical protein AAFN48_10585, partial [Pseudomonadota bacterium]